MIGINVTSARVVSIELFAGTTSMGPRMTGFWVRHRGRLFLVSNYHAFAARDADTGIPFDYGKGPLPSPERFKTSLAIKDGNKLWFHDVEEELLSDLQPLWLQHPKGRKYDVAAFPFMDDSPALENAVAFNSTDFISVQSVFSEIAIVGYPMDLNLQDGLPVWKSGVVASEPFEPLGGLPAFTIDALTRAGMSGSPVLLRKQAVRFTSKATILQANDGEEFRVAGIYSGRFGAKKLSPSLDEQDEVARKLWDLQIGRAFHSRVIHEVLEDGITWDRT